MALSRCGVSIMKHKLNIVTMGTACGAPIQENPPNYTLSDVLPNCRNCRRVIDTRRRRLYDGIQQEEIALRARKT